MLYSSTRGNDENLTFTEILLKGLAGDGGLYIPNNLPFFNYDELDKLRDLDYSDLAFELTKKFVANDISSDDYKRICLKTYEKSFGKKTISINKLNKNEYITNLFHGPTFAFKDYALQLLGNIYDFILKKKKINLIILGATSGDTGSAAIYGCSKSSNVKIFILFPKGKVSEIQRRQMTTFNKPNVYNIAVNGDFDDCQKLVKGFFKLNNKKKKINLAAVNSINWVRIMGQIVYYFWTYFRVTKDFLPLNFVVPTGNFGNAYAGFISKNMGLPINKIVVSSNKNDVLTRFFESGKMRSKKTLRSLSPSMDIQISSNFERLLFDFYKEGRDIKRLMKKLETENEFEVSQSILIKIKEHFEYGSISDEDTLETIKNVNSKYNIIIDPHTAVGYKVGKKKLGNQEKRVYLATAHCSKFINTVSDALDRNINYPKELENLLKKKEDYHLIDNDINKLQKYILNSIKL